MSDRPEVRATVYDLEARKQAARNKKEALAKKVSRLNKQAANDG